MEHGPVGVLGQNAAHLVVWGLKTKPGPAPIQCQCLVGLLVRENLLYRVLVCNLGVKVWK